MGNRTVEGKELIHGYDILSSSHEGVMFVIHLRMHR